MFVLNQQTAHRGTMRHSSSNRRALAVLLTLLAAALAGDRKVEPAILKPDAELPEINVEVDLGERRYDLGQEKQHAPEVINFYAKEVGLVNDPEQQARVEAIAHRIITAANRLGPVQVRLDAPGQTPGDGMEFCFRILDSDEINAFSAWGGNIYLTRGMIEFCQSDHELAGILGHEVAHSMYHHLRDQVRRIQQFNTQQILVMVAAAFMGVNVAHAGLITQYVHLALLNGHSVEAERQADWAGCFYTYRAGYDPVGMITCFERLERLYRSRPHAVELGAFQTHPWSDERARSLEAQIRQLGLPVDRRAVIRALTAEVRTTEAEGDTPARVELLLGERLLFEPRWGTPEQTAEDRAADAALAINKALNRGLRSTDIRLVPAGESWLIRATARFEPINLLEVHPADAAGGTTAELAGRVWRTLVAACRQEEITNGRL